MLVVATTVGAVEVAFSDVAVAVGADQVPSPRRNVVELAVPEPRRAVPTVPVERLDAFSAVSAAPLPENDVPVTAPVSDSSSS